MSLYPVNHTLYVIYSEEYVCFVSLVQVPATEGEFESSMKDNAQTREHATLLKALVSRQKNLLQTYHMIELSFNLSYLC